MLVAAFKIPERDRWRRDLSDQLAEKRCPILFLPILNSVLSYSPVRFLVRFEYKSKF